MGTPIVDDSSPLQGRLFTLGLNTPVWLMVPLALLVSLLLPLPIRYAIDLFSSEALGGPALQSHGIVFALIEACLLAPLIETAFSQWGCITLLRKKLKASPGVAIAMSAALFAALHTYSWAYVLITFPTGLVLGYVFVVEQARRGRAFLIVALIHALRNAISLALIFML